MAVVGIIDETTLKLDNGSLLRLAGIIPPQHPIAVETNPDGARNLKQKTIATLASMLLGRSVRLAFDNIRQDRYGRQLAQVYLPTENAAGAGKSPAKSLWLQAYLLRHGLARAHAPPQQDACLSALIRQENEAIVQRAGLWQSAAYRVRDARRPRDLARYRGSYQIVTGRVLKVGSSRTRYYLNFDQDWRRDFTVGIDKRVAKTFAAAGFDVKDLAGRHLRIRGWISMRNGPFIDVQNRWQIEERQTPQR